MAQPVAAQPQAVQLNPLFHEVPIKEAASLNRKAFALKTLSTITMVAVVAIVAAVLAVSLGMGAVSGTLPFILLGLAIATPFLSMAAAKLRSLAGGTSLEDWSLDGGYQDQAKIERGVANELEIIANWTGVEIQQFFAQNNWSMDHLPMEALRMRNQQDPLRVLLPIVARYIFCCKVFNKLEADFQAARDKRYADPRLGLASRNVMNYIRENTGIPFALDAAVMSQVIQNPTLQIRSHREIVRIDQRSFDLRECARRFDQNDNYLIFRDLRNPEANDPARAPISLAELEQDLSPEAFRRRLFPAVRI